MESCSSRIDRRPVAFLHLSGGRYLLFFQRLFFLLTGFVIVLAFGGSIVLLVFDTSQSLLLRLAHAPLSALPLLSIGLASLCFQIVTQPKLLDLFKAFIVSSAFILWGIDQLLPMGWYATTLGDIVIVLYVIDLGWMMTDRLRQQSWPRQARQQPESLSVHTSQNLHLSSSLPVATLVSLPVVRVTSFQAEKHCVASRSVARVPRASSVLKRYRLTPLQSNHCCADGHHPSTCSCKCVRTSAFAHE